MDEKKYRPLTLPTLQWNKKVSTPFYGELIVQPLESGFGVTLGNSLRRIALSSIEGSAVTSVIIKGANNEFSSLKGVVEDVLHILLNIKELVVSNATGKPGMMRLQVSGERVVKASDIVADSHLAVLNRDHILAQLASDGELEIDFFVQTGRGYVPAQWPKGIKVQPDGRIYLDAMFSPVKRIEYVVEKTRVGQAIDYDKLIFKIHTNGAINPQEVVHYSTSVLRTQLEHFLDAREIPFNAISHAENEAVQKEKAAYEKSPTKGLPVELFLKPIDQLEFSVRAHNCLVGAGVKRVIDLVNLREDEVLKIKNFGQKSLEEVKEILHAFRLSFGMNIKELDLKRMIKEQEDNLGS